LTCLNRELVHANRFMVLLQISLHKFYPNLWMQVSRGKRKKIVYDDLRKRTFSYKTLHQKGLLTIGSCVWYPANAFGKVFVGRGYLEGINLHNCTKRITLTDFSLISTVAHWFKKKTLHQKGKKKYPELALVGTGWLNMWLCLLTNQ
jgi:hypothetical protein